MVAFSRTTKNTFIHHQPKAAFDDFETTNTRCRGRIPGIEHNHEGRTCVQET